VCAVWQMAAIVTITTLWTLDYNILYRDIDSLRKVLTAGSAAANSTGQIDPSFLAQLAGIGARIGEKGPSVATLTVVVLAIYAGVCVAIFLVHSSLGCDRRSSSIKPVSRAGDHQPRIMAPLPAREAAANFVVQLALDLGSNTGLSLGYVCASARASQPPRPTIRFADGAGWRNQRHNRPGLDATVWPSGGPKPGWDTR
jgi:hypothetical protein